MIEVDSTERGVRAVDSAKTSIEVETDDWVSAEQSLALSRPVDTTLAGETSVLRFPPVFVVAERLDGDATFELGSEVGPIDLPPDEYVVRVDGNVLTYVRFDGAARLEKPGYEQAIISFPEPTTVTLGFRSRVQSPPETMTVPRTPAGVATALSHFPAGHRTATPDRSFPTMRGHPPLVEFGDETDVPDVVAERREAVDVELTLPPRLDYLFPVSSLAHYLGATVRTEPAATPTLRTPDRTRELSSLPEFPRECAALLRRAFMLDCLVRNAGPYGTDLSETRHLETLGLDAAALYDRPISSRLDAYLDAPFERVSEAFPEWHLSMYVDPTFDHVETLPYLLSILPNVFLPSSEPLSGSERLSRSLDDFYRRQESSVSVDLVKPDLGPGRVHGWLAPSAPIDVFKAVPSAYSNRFDYRRRASEPISVVAVLNDNEMAEEHAEAARIYRHRATELDLDITVREHLSTDELADVFETSHDLVHYIGHCEESGLRCRDGNLSVSSLRESNAQTFFLNACGSFHEGVELVRQGSVAGAVTFNKVLDSHAARVGTTFARLLMNGFCIERALRLSRRRIMMGKDYTVVGDGTHVLTQSENYVPGEIELSNTPDGQFDLTYEVFSPSAHGGYYQPYLPGNDQSHLIGYATSHRLDREALTRFLDIADTPVVYDGDIHWSNELRRELE
ncbi:hypothetical protein SAMN04487948_104400 [Halogranum amylolyticum]|uniref:CHAT domain-containing protein n=1 Tax=Halogranum amylolyticum TaxID=660520 RepID=A0A1H8S311_9EURY|nr:hypothetical protein [Halogranum amylolyticum]SEO72814.1 hypothetical protein SAMN04487948_104400 [Halogranum amylolyticum]